MDSSNMELVGFLKIYIKKIPIAHDGSFGIWGNEMKCVYVLGIKWKKSNASLI